MGIEVHYESKHGSVKIPVEDAKAATMKVIELKKTGKAWRIRIVKR